MHIPAESPTERWHDDGATNHTEHLSQSEAHRRAHAQEAARPTNFVWQAGNWHQGIEPAATSDLHDASLGCPTCVAPLALAVEWRRWYYAAVTWMDHSLGRALTRLEEMGDATAARTITVFQCVAVRQSDFAALIKLNTNKRR